MVPDGRPCRSTDRLLSLDTQADFHRIAIAIAVIDEDQVENAIAVVVENGKAGIAGDGPGGYRGSIFVFEGYGIRELGIAVRSRVLIEIEHLAAPVLVPSAGDQVLLAILVQIDDPDLLPANTDADFLAGFGLELGEFIKAIGFLRPLVDEELGDRIVRPQNQIQLAIVVPIDQAWRGVSIGDLLAAAKELDTGLEGAVRLALKAMDLAGGIAGFRSILANDKIEKTIFVEVHDTWTDGAGASGFRQADQAAIALEVAHILIFRNGCLADILIEPDLPTIAGASAWSDAPGGPITEDQIGFAIAIPVGKFGTAKGDLVIVAHNLAVHFQQVKLLELWHSILLGFISCRLTKRKQGKT